MYYIFNEKRGQPVGGWRKPDKKIGGNEIDMDYNKRGKLLPFAELRAELFHPTRIDISKIDTSHLFWARGGGSNRFFE